MVIPPPVCMQVVGALLTFDEISAVDTRARGMQTETDFMANWNYRRLRIFLGLIFCWSFRVTDPAASTLQAQESAPAVAQTVPVAIPYSLSAVLPEQDSVAIADAQSPTPITVPASTGREVTWRALPENVLHDQKEIWLFPVQLAHGKRWLPTAAVVGVTAGLLALDAHDVAYFRRTNSFSRFNGGFSGPITGVEIALVPAAMYSIGLLRKDSYARRKPRCYRARPSLIAGSS